MNFLRVEQLKFHANYSPPIIWMIISRWFKCIWKKFKMKQMTRPTFVRRRRRHPLPPRRNSKRILKVLWITRRYRKRQWRIISWTLKKVWPSGKRTDYLIRWLLNTKMVRHCAENIDNIFGFYNFIIIKIILGWSWWRFTRRKIKNIKIFFY